MKLKKLINDMCGHLKETVGSNLPAPIFKHQVKLHKEGRHVRPSVSFIGAPSYKLVKVISKLFIQIKIGIYKDI